MTRALAFLLVLSLTTSAAAQAPAQGPDLSMPGWTYCLPLPAGQAPTPAALAGFTQDQVRQLLRLQENAQYGARLTTLHEALEAKLTALTTELEAAQRSYTALQQAITTQNTSLSTDLVRAQGEIERYRARAERRRIWPWISLGFGLIGGILLGVAVAR